jgi:hypothetical protein
MIFTTISVVPTRSPTFLKHGGRADSRHWGSESFPCSSKNIPAHLGLTVLKQKKKDAKKVSG